MTVSSLTDIPAIRNYLERIGAEPRSLLTAVIKQDRGAYWTDLAVIRFKKDGTIVAQPEFAPTQAEADQISEAIQSATWPELRELDRLDGKEPFADAPKKDVFEFRDQQNKIVMVQVREEYSDRFGDLRKAYFPYTFWSDGQWRRMEPEGKLPLFNLPKLRNAFTVFLHEGAKAAAHVQWMVEAETFDAKDALKEHPWGEFLSSGVHLGWIGGALNPSRTDWSPLMKAGVSHVIIVADNDAPGRRAVPAIAKQLRLPVMLLQFRDEFPVSFDLADPFPDAMFREIDGKRIYVGPQPHDCLHPATWATDLVNVEKRKVAVLRDSFKGQWIYCEKVDLFICRQRPDVQRTEAALNRALAAFSDAKDTAHLIAKSFEGKHIDLCYRPDLAGTMVTVGGTSAINLHVKCRLPEREGDPDPFLEFIDYLVPDAREKQQLLRWVATLIARPEVRMGYGLLMISETQGVGKTTLGEKILAPLVGPGNASFPSEHDLGSEFNEWCACKRLVVVSEIYCGNSWKIYNGLKAIVTDNTLTVNCKYQRPYRVDNWVHFFACSNSRLALKIQDEDRRWFRPELTETAWPAGKFLELRRWLDSGGLQIIKHWAKQFGDYVGPQEQAPMTDSKKEMIEASRSDAQKEAVAVAEALVERTVPLALMMRDVRVWCREHQQGQMHDTDYDLRKAMKRAGVVTLGRRIGIAQRKQHVLMNAALAELVKEQDDPKVIRDIILKYSTTCGTLMGGKDM